MKASVQAACMTLTAMTINRCQIIVQNKTTNNKNAALVAKDRKKVLYITAIIWIGNKLLIYFI